jgi:hypothetical protein
MWDACGLELHLTLAQQLTLGKHLDVVHWPRILTPMQKKANPSEHSRKYPILVYEFNRKITPIKANYQPVCAKKFQKASAYKASIGKPTLFKGHPWKLELTLLSKNLLTALQGHGGKRGVQMPKCASWHHCRLQSLKVTAKMQNNKPSPGQSTWVLTAQIRQKHTQAKTAKGNLSPPWHHIDPVQTPASTTDSSGSVDKDRGMALETMPSTAVLVKTQGQF